MCENTWYMHFILYLCSGYKRSTDEDKATSLEWSQQLRAFSCAFRAVLIILVYVHINKCKKVSVNNTSKQLDEVY